MVICGQCNELFPGDTEYLAHVCSVTGVDPSHPATMGPDYKDMQLAALQRGHDQAVAQGDSASAAATAQAIEDLKAQV